MIRRKLGIKFFVQVWDKAKKKIEEIIGLDFDRFTRSILLAQGAFSAFIEAKGKERSEILEKITGTEIYSKISQKTYQKFKEAESYKRNLIEKTRDLKEKYLSLKEELACYDLKEISAKKENLKVKIYDDQKKIHLQKKYLDLKKEEKEAA